MLLPTREYLVRLLVIIALFLCSASYYKYRNLTECDLIAQRELVWTQTKYVPKYIESRYFAKENVAIRMFEKCGYVSGRAFCPDVRLDGMTLLRQIQLVALRLLAVLMTICDKHGLQFWLMRGTLLGAARHRGFIPWDNEIDVGMHQSDYQKLISVVQSELPNDIFLQNGDTDPFFADVRASEAKLRDNNSCLCLCLRTGCRNHDGIMVDIFVFNDIGDGMMRDKWAYDDVIRRDAVFPLNRLEFEGTLFPVPNQYKALLQEKFGSAYMQHPPVEYQCPSKGYIGHPWHSCQSISLMDQDAKLRTIQESRISHSWILWYWK